MFHLLSNRCIEKIFQVFKRFHRLISNSSLVISRVRLRYEILDVRPVTQKALF